ncbi:hypothetical protein UPYG_G00236870 [Umbra pygmaea]|uniref:Ig-like domain-containing protein n=1 Tax=Umbra pygmaea TaxID=75934 RepID=A0ABD0X509_UMBPY
MQQCVCDKPKAVLSISPQWLNPGDSVTLSCKVKETSTGWRFSWYKTVPYRAGLPSQLDQSYSVEPLSGKRTTERSYTLSPAGPTHTGGYVCRAGRGDPVYYTHYSEPQFTWSGDLLSSVSLRIGPNRTQHFTSESLSLSCDLKRNSTGWRIMRHTDTGVESGCPSNRGSITGFTCTITSINTEDSGVYWCESGSREYSNAVNITVHDKAKAVLSIYPQLLNPGDSVTLSCKVKELSTGWRFSWYKTVPYRAELPSLLDQSYSVEPLSGERTNEESYTLSLAGPIYTRGYVCKAGRGDPVYYTNYSNPQFTWSGDLQSSVSLRMSPNRIQHFTLKSLSLSCDLKGNSTGWRLMRYTETGVKSGCPSNRGSITGFTCTITSINTEDSGVYWCESGSGEYSNAVNITVHGTGANFLIYCVV